MEVELPDGTILEFPEGTSEDVMRSAVQRYIAKQDGKKKTQGATDDLVTQAQAAFAAGNDAEGKRLLTEANRMAIDAGNVPEGFVADPRTGGFSDLARDPSIPEMGKLASFGFGAMQGLGANFGDEAIGKTLSLMGEDQQFATERAREMERRASENPMSYYGGYIPGAIASALSLGKATGMTGATTNGGMALQGAGLGGTAAANRASSATIPTRTRWPRTAPGPCMAAIRPILKRNLKGMPRWMPNKKPADRPSAHAWLDFGP